MWFTFGLAGFVLLIACANLANLQLVRSTARMREHSVRAALGARRFRLLRQSMTESLVLACLGGALSLLLAYGAIEFIDNRLFASLPGASVTVDFTVFGFAFLISLLTGVLFGTVPAWLASRADVNQALKESPRGSTSGAHHRLRHALIVGEVAFAVILLAGAGLFLRGLQRFESLDHGWRPDGLLTGQLGLQGQRYATPEQRLTFYQQLEQKLLSIPGVQRVALSNSMPIWGFNSSGGVRIEGQPEPEPGKWPEVFFEQVSRDYFEAIGLRLISGRTFNATDVAGNTEVVIINDTMARRFWPNENPLGKRIGRTANRPWMEVIGVVSDVSFPASLAEPYTRLQAFRPLTQGPGPFVNVTVRTTAAPDDLAQPMRRALADLDPTLALHRRSAPHAAWWTRASAASLCSARCLERLPLWVSPSQQSASTESRLLRRAAHERAGNPHGARRTHARRALVDSVHRSRSDRHRRPHRERRSDRGRTSADGVDPDVADARPGQHWPA